MRTFADDTLYIVTNVIRILAIKKRADVMLSGTFAILSPTDNTHLERSIISDS